MLERDRATDPDALRDQYGTAAKLRARQESHELYSEREFDLVGAVLALLVPRPGLRLVDVGCGPGMYHPPLGRAGVEVVAVDPSSGMVQEARRQALGTGLPVSVARASADALPLPDGSVDRAMANHVLYHVPDRVQALRELRRVLKPGGRAVVATNAADSLGRLRDLHAAVARDLGYAPSRPPDQRFSLDDVPLVHDVFPTAQRHVFPNAFVFPTAETALRYYGSGFVDDIEHPPSDGRHRDRLLRDVGARIEAIVRREGSFRVEKTVGCFVADV